jgi:hypothetical protein
MLDALRASWRPPVGQAFTVRPRHEAGAGTSSRVSPDVRSIACSPEDGQTDSMRGSALQVPTEALLDKAAAAIWKRSCPDEPYSVDERDAERRACRADAVVALEVVWPYFVRATTTPGWRHRPPPTATKIHRPAVTPPVLRPMGVAGGARWA